MKPVKDLWIKNSLVLNVMHSNKTGNTVAQAYIEVWAIKVGIGVKNDSFVDFEIFIFFTYLYLSSITSM